tara:strand:- start:804 stop:1415 length:612 start_codon:yes stop_codon:yes gene_type:complete
MQTEFTFFNNRKPLTEQVFDTLPTVRVKQVHSADVIKVDAPLTEWVEADALVTRTPNLPIGVITADCAPIILMSDNVVGAAHAGWQGAVAGVLENTVQAMKTESENIVVYIGPCIAQKSYEVSVGFETPFLDHDPLAEKFFMPGREGKLHFDLAGYCAFRLSACGVRKIHIDGRDTLTDPNFYSHRGGATAIQRNLSAVMIKG